MITSSLISVGTTAILLHTASGRTKIVVGKSWTQNNNTFLGDSTVTAPAGFHLPNNSQVTIELSDGDSLYAINQGASDSISVIATN